MDVIEKIEEKNAENVKRVFKDLISSYLTPAFGSMTKRDFDILLFMKLQELNIFDSDPEIYEVVSSLKVTRTKARNLLYEAKMRNTSEQQLDIELKELIKKPILLKDNDKILLEVGNPFLIDHLRSKLKKLGHITDGSFSAELVKLTEKAYLALFESVLPNESKKQIKKTLVECGIAEDTSFKGIMSSILKKLGNKAAGEVANKVVDNTFEYLSPIIDGSIDAIKDKMHLLFKESNDESE